MVLLYEPGVYMPESADDFGGTSWMITWDDGPWHLHDVEPGGTVFLVGAGDPQRVVWETRVTQSFEVPYESIDDLANELLRRWAVLIEDEVMSSGRRQWDGWAPSP